MSVIITNHDGTQNHTLLEVNDAYSKNDVYSKVEVDNKLTGKANSTHTHNAATLTSNGFMSSADKKNLDYIANDIKTNLDDILGIPSSSLLSTIYPIGAVYISVNSTSPNTLFGGRWEQIQGKFLLASDTSHPAGSTGGEANHTLTVSEMPGHTHTLERQKWFDTDSVTGSKTIRTWAKDTVNGELSSLYAGERDLLSTGGGQPHNNMPPYLSVYMWKRVA